MVSSISRFASAGLLLLAPIAWAGSPWELERHGTVAATLEPNDEAGSYRVTGLSSDKIPAWQVKLRRDHLAVQAKQTYTIEFSVRAAKPRDVFVAVTQAHAPWKNLGIYQLIQATDQWQTKKQSFESTDSDDNARLHFDLGGSPHDVEIKNIRFLRGNDDLLAKPAKPPAASPTAPAPPPDAPAWDLETHGDSKAKLTPGEANSLRVDISAIDKKLSIWSIKLRRDKLAIEAGKPHVLNVRVKASEKRTVVVAVSQSQSPWKALGLFKEIPVGPEWSTQKIEFTPTDSDSNARLFFDLGSSPASVLFAEISLTGGGKEVLAAKNPAVRWTGTPTVVASTASTPTPFKAGAGILRLGEAMPKLDPKATSPAPTIKPGSAPSIAAAPTAKPAPSTPSNPAPAKTGSATPSTTSSVDYIRAGKWRLERHDGVPGELIVASDMNSARVILPQNVGGEPWRVSLSQDKLQVTGGRQYRLTFRVRSDQPRAIGVGVAQAHPPWGFLGLHESVQATPQWHEFKMPFNAGLADGNARILFELGGPPATVEVSDVRLE